MYNYLYITLLKFLIYKKVKNIIFIILDVSKFYKIKIYQIFLLNIYIIKKFAKFFLQNIFIYIILIIFIYLFTIYKINKLL